MNESPWILVLALGVLSAPSPLVAGASPIRHLEAQASAVDILGHGDVDEYGRCYFNLAAEYRKHGQDAREEAALRNAVSVVPDAFDRQLRLAALERESNPERAVARLRWMLEQLQDKGMIALAEQMLKDPRLAPLHGTLTRPPAHHDQKLFVLGLGTVDPVVIRGVMTRLSQALGVECAQLPTITVDDPTLRTTLRSRQLDHYMLRAATELGPVSYHAELGKQGLSPFARLTVQQKEDFVEKYFAGREEGKHFEGTLSKTDAPQFESTSLIGHLSSTYAARLAEPNCLGILAITSDDLYSGHNRYVFGTTTATVGVISVARLMRADDPRHLVVQRLGKQALHTAGHVIPLGECASQGCPRSVANVMEDIDAKGDELCDTCHEALEQLWKRRAGMMTSSLR